MDEGQVAALLVGLALLPAALLLHLLAAKMKAGMLPRNRTMGLRTRKLQVSDEAWEIGHRAALPHIYAAAWVSYGAAALSVSSMLLIPGEESAGLYLGTVIGLFALVVLFLCWSSVRSAHRAVDERLDDASGGAAV